MHETSDYRNGKYEGQMNINKQRHGLGVFIDDDLTYYVSHWNQNKINGLSLIYISHGKYIYGQWKNNQPHGLTIFRSGDTVLVGRCQNGKPVHKCLVIFQKFSFACILQQKQDQWVITQSGNLINYQTLIKYIQMIEVPVPDYFFSLTKFACHFSKNSPSLKTFPCFTNCCYFGYSNGLALIFNSSNALISIGQHYDEEICEFGGRFDGLRSAEQGNFEMGGQIVSYSGIRPHSKIYGIFQKIHKKSLNFRNEYFDSKIKYFSNIEQLLKSKLNQISNECRKSKSFKNIDLNDSLEYQQYTQQQSFKIHSIRQNLYQPLIHQRQSIQLSPSISKQFEDITLKSPKYFRKNNKKQEIKKQNNQKQIQEIKSPKNISKPLKLTQFNPKNIKDINDHYIQVNTNTTNTNNNTNNKKINIINNYINNNLMKQYQQQQSIQPFNPFTPSKLKQKMKSNNLRYINNGTPKNQNGQQDKKDKLNSIIKSNSIYRQMKNIKKQKQQQININYKQINNQNQPSFKNNNFKYFNYDDQPQSNKIQQPIKSKYNNIKNNDIYSTKNTDKTRNQKSISNLQKSKPTQHTPKKYILEQQQKNSQRKQISQQRSSPIKTTCLAKPSYEQIQERRKRIISQYKQLNSPVNKNGHKKFTYQQNIKNDHNQSNQLSSTNKQSQNYYPYIASNINQINSNIYKKQQKINLTQKNENKVLKPIETNKQKQILTNKANKDSKYPSMKIHDEQSNRYENTYQNKLKCNIQNEIISNKNTSTPQRIRKNYNYLYE